jgi:hypothetical protein
MLKPEQAFLIGVGLSIGGVILMTTGVTLLAIKAPIPPVITGGVALVGGGIVLAGFKTCSKVLNEFETN